MIVTIPKPEIPSWVSDRAHSLGLNLKSEFHFTLTSRTIDQETPGIELLSVSEFNVTFLPYYWVAKRFYDRSEYVTFPHTRTSLVQMVDVSNLDRLYQVLKRPCPQFPHVTLFVGSDRPDEPTAVHGIAIERVDEDGLTLEQIQPHRL